MGQQETTQESFQTTRLSPELRRGATGALLGAEQLYGSPAPLPSTYVGIDPTRRAALESMAARAEAEPVWGAAYPEWQRTVGGEYLNANPYLDEVVARSVGAAGRAPTAGAVGAGRFGTGSWANAVQDIGQATAARLYGQNYQMERDRMQRALAMVPTMQAAQYVDPTARAAVGSAYEADEAARRGEEMRQFMYPYWRQQQYEGSLAGSPLTREADTAAEQVTRRDFDWASMLGTLGGSLLGGPAGGQIAGAIGNVPGQVAGWFGGGGNPYAGPVPDYGGFPAYGVTTPATNPLLQDYGLIG